MVIVMFANIFGVRMILLFFGGIGTGASLLEGLVPTPRGAHRSHGKLFFKISAVTIRTIRRLVQLDDFFKQLTAGPAFIFIDWHGARIHQMATY